MIDPVSISPKALKEIQHIMKNKNIPMGYGLRIGIKGGGGCSSAMSFMLGFDQEKENDLSYEIQGVPIYLEKKHTMYLIGMEVDFYEGNDARGFTFNKKEAS